MCDFKVGDEVVCINNENDDLLKVGSVYTVAEFLAAGDGHEDWTTDVDSVQLVEIGHVEDDDVYGFAAEHFRKVQRRNSRLTLESFFTVPGGFEEPKRTPAKTPERV